MHQKVGALGSSGWSSINLGDIYRKLNNLGSARRWYEQATAVGSRIGDAAIEGWAINGLVDVHIEKQNWKAALELCTQVLKIREKSGDKSLIISSYDRLGYLYEKQMQFAKAIAA